MLVWLKSLIKGKKSKVEEVSIRKMKVDRAISKKGIKLTRSLRIFTQKK